MIEVRGEVYLPRAGCDRMNAEATARGEKLYVNPRNAAAGSLRQLDSAVTAGRPLRLWAYQVVEADGFAPESQWAALESLRSFGFPVTQESRRLLSFEEVAARCEEFGEERRSLPYETDGLVVKIDSFATLAVPALALLLLELMALYQCPHLNLHPSQQTTSQTSQHL